MKNIILVRHGKSSWDYAVADRNRPLLERGISDAQKVAERFRSEKMEIQAVFSSPAIRALHTCMVFMRKLDISYSKLLVSNHLYDFSGDSVLDFIKGLDDGLDTILCFGHNQAYTDIANSLGNTYIENVPTSGLVHLVFDVDQWSEVSKGVTERTLFPKQIKT